MRPERNSIFSSLFRREFWLAVAIFCALSGIAARAAFASTAPTQQTPEVVYDSQSFQQELSRVKAGLQTANQSTAALRAFRESLPPSWSVRVGSRLFHVPTDLLVSRLKEAEMQPEFRTIDVKQAQNYLDALSSETASLSTLPVPSEDSARTKLNAILSRPEYARAIQETWWDRMRARINEMLLDALISILSSVGGQKSLGYILLWIAVCAAAVFIAYTIFRRWIRAAKGEEMALQSADLPVRSWQEWVYAARDAAAHGDNRVAVHCAYWAGIARLQDLGSLSADRANTPREYLAALAKSQIAIPETLATRQRALQMLTMRFEKMWYGYHVATEEDFRDSLTQLETLGCRLP